MSTMLTTALFFLAIVACISAAALRSSSDGFSLMNIDGERHFGYGVVPQTPGEMMQLEFYDVDFGSGNCSDLRVDVYSNGYLRGEGEHVDTLCDAGALGDYVAHSPRGFFISMTSSSAVRQGQIKARFHVPGGFKITQEILHR